ncbi:MAG: hypothetical protein CMC35_07740 [Flavobacteriaceae bacterium]|nr:hypothetical protein [Flavobacteriaceae bacterium]
MSDGTNDTADDGGTDPMTVSTFILNISDITNSGASVSASAESSGVSILERGFCWGTSPNPDVDNASVAVGAGNGDFSNDIEGLLANTTYYIKSYALVNESTIHYSEDMIFTTLPNDGEVFDGSIELSSQIEVDQFGANNYTGITGSLYISNNTDITSISSLASIEFVGEFLSISGNVQLSTLEGLNNLETIGGAFFLINNPLLENFQGMNSLRTIHSTLEVIDNESLENFNGLESLQSTKGLHISQNQKLQNFTGLGELSHVDGILTIDSNPTLISLTGFENVITISQSLQVVDNSALVDMDGFDSLRSIGGKFVIRGNSQMTLINGLHNLNSIMADLRITGNNLQEIDGFTHLESVGGRIAISFENIENIDGFNNLSNVREIHLNYNYALSNLDGFLNLLSVEEDFWVRNHHKLTDFCGITKLINANGIGDDYKVEYNLFNPTIEDIQMGSCSK